MRVCASPRACVDIHVQARLNTSRGSGDGRRWLLLTCTMLAHRLLRRSDENALIKLGSMQMARFLLHMRLVADSPATLRSTDRRAHSRVLLDGFLLSSALITGWSAAWWQGSCEAGHTLENCGTPPTWHMAVGICVIMIV